MTKLLIKPFEPRYQHQVEELVLTIQNEEFKLNITAQHQPDLPDLKSFYQDKEGEFWIAVDATDAVLGCIGFEKLDNTNGALRKMFLKKEVRGNKELNVAQQLYDILIVFAKDTGTRSICLDTPLVAHAAHRFYERNGWTMTPIEKLPHSYKIPKIDPKLIKFYVLNF
jgi:N-acetylglutamate synthase-like GNAT family acetyltransferase